MTANKAVEATGYRRLTADVVRRPTRPRSRSRPPTRSLPPTGPTSPASPSPARSPSWPTPTPPRRASIARSCR